MKLSTNSIVKKKPYTEKNHKNTQNEFHLRYLKKDLRQQRLKTTQNLKVKKKQLKER